MIYPDCVDNIGSKVYWREGQASLAASIVEPFEATIPQVEDTALRILTFRLKRFLPEHRRKFRKKKAHEVKCSLTGHTGTI